MKNVFLLLFSILTALCIAEIGTRCFWYPNSINISRTEFSDRGYILNPQSGEGTQKIGKTTITCNYYWPHLRDTQIKRGSNNILVLGDSFTFGWMLPWNETYVYHLQTYSNNFFGKDKFIFLNAAVGGWGLADFLAYLEEYGEYVNPGFVLIFFNTDDIGRAIKRDIYKLSDVNSSQLVTNYHPLKFVKLRKLLFNNWLYEHSMLLQFVRNNLSLSHLVQIKNDSKIHSNVVVPISADLRFQDKAVISLGQALFLKIAQWCDLHKAKLLVVTTGFNAFYPKNLHDPTKIFLEQDNFFKKNHISYYDIAPVFVKSVQGKKFQIPNDGHPNELAANLIAQLNWPWIKQQLNDKSSLL